MKKLLLLTILIIAIISLVGCNNYKIDNNTTTNINTEKITIEQAKEIALKHANLESNQVNFIKTEVDFDNNIKKYDIEFYYENKEYDYEINAVNGEILKVDYDMESYINQQEKSWNTRVTIDQAKEIAIKHSNLVSNEVVLGKCELDFDNGIKKYDIKFYYNNNKYDYEIDANTGEILSYDKE